MIIFQSENVKQKLSVIAKMIFAILTSIVNGRKLWWFIESEEKAHETIYLTTFMIISTRHSQEAAKRFEQNFYLS